jgi:hypothetical protein
VADAEGTCIPGIRLAAHAGTARANSGECLTNASAQRRSSGYVIFTFQREVRTTGPGLPSARCSSASSVTARFDSRASAAQERSARKTCGVVAATSSLRGTVSTILPVLHLLHGLDEREARDRGSVFAAASTTAATSIGSTSGRAASCTQTKSSSSPSRRRTRWRPSRAACTPPSPRSQAAARLRRTARTRAMVLGDAATRRA